MHVLIAVIAVVFGCCVVGIDLWCRLPRRAPVAAAGGTGPFLFPSGFLWGAATADHQIERSQPDNWSAFEREARAHLRQDRLTKGVVQPGHIADIANVPLAWMELKGDFDTHYDDDLALAADLGHGAHRFSISWARLFPRAGMTAPDDDGLAFYDGVFASLQRHGLAPFVTLFHFASPQWLWQKDKNGKRGLESADAIVAFELFVRVVVERWGPQVRSWCTLNEPMVVVYSGYLEGTFPPNERRAGPKDVVDVGAQLLRMHAAAFHIIKRADANASVGIAQHVRRFLPLRNFNPLDRLQAHFIEQAFILDFLDAIASGIYAPITTGISMEIPGLKGTADYLGVNYYGRFYIRSTGLMTYDVVTHDKEDSAEAETDVGWAIDEMSLVPTLVQFHRRYGLPIHILENGMADHAVDDVKRQRFLVRHIQAIWQALQKDVVVHSYFHWSLVDNFEWALGFTPRFGLYAVDYDKNQLRTPRGSVDVYRSIAAANSVAPDVWARFRR